MVVNLAPIIVKRVTSLEALSGKSMAVDAFNEIQRSPRYASGFALRFARVTRIREDKAAGDSDTLDRVWALYEAQFRYKARMAP